LRREKPWRLALRRKGRRTARDWWSSTRLA